MVEDSHESATVGSTEEITQQAESTSAEETKTAASTSDNELASQVSR